MKFQEVVQRSIEIGSRQGRITFDRINAICQDANMEPEEIELLLNELRNAAIEVVER